MSLNINNPWLVTIIGGSLAAILAGVVHYYLLGRKRKRTPELESPFGAAFLGMENSFHTMGQ